MKTFSSFLMISVCLLSSCLNSTAQTPPRQSSHNKYESTLKEQMDQLNDPVSRNERILGKSKNPNYTPQSTNPKKLESNWRW